jgi:hypothetical protein
MKSGIIGPMIKLVFSLNDSISSVPKPSLKIWVRDSLDATIKD